MVQPTQIASIEYAAKVLGATLCVVMGHSKCGAVQAALDSEIAKGPDLGPNIDSLISLIRPAVLRSIEARQRTPLPILDLCIQENVYGTAREIMAKSSLLRTLASENRFKVVEAVCNLETGKVQFHPEEPVSIRAVV